MTEPDWIDERFEAKVMVVYRLSHGDRYYTNDILFDEKGCPGDIYTIIDRNEDDISNPRLISHWPAKRRKYAEKLKSCDDK